MKKHVQTSPSLPQSARLDIHAGPIDAYSRWIAGLTKDRPLGRHLVTIWESFFQEVGSFFRTTHGY